MALTYRQIKGSPLTIEEADDNIQTLADMIGSIDTSAFVTLGTAQSITGQKTFAQPILAIGGVDMNATGGTDILNLGVVSADQVVIGRNDLTSIIQTRASTYTLLTSNNISLDSGGTASLVINPSSIQLSVGGTSTVTLDGNLSIDVPANIDIQSDGYLSLFSNTAIYAYYDSNGLSIDSSGFKLDSSGLDIEIEALSFTHFINTADATSIITGAVRISGGVGIEKKLYVGGVINAIGGIDVPSTGGTDILNIGTTGADIINIGGVTTTSTKIFGDLAVDSTKGFYYGDPAVDTTWRTIRSGNNLENQRREAGVYNTKQIFASNGAFSAGSILIFDTSVYKIALDIGAVNNLRIGQDFTGLSLVPVTIGLTGSNPIVSAIGGGSLTIQNSTAAQPVNLRTVGDANANSGVIMTLNANATNSTTARAIATITGTYRPTSGTTANFRGINIINTIDEQAPAANTITLIDIQPTLTNVRGTIYALRSRINTPVPGAGTPWNLFIDGTAPNFMGGTLNLQSSTVGNNLLTYTTVTGGTTNAVVNLLQNRVLTTNATVTTLQTFATLTDVNYYIEVKVSARRTGGSAGAAGDSGIMIGTVRVKNVAGVLIVMNNFVDNSSADQAWTIGWTTSGTNILLQVTGTANNNITWIMTEAKVFTAGG